MKNQEFMTSEEIKSLHSALVKESKRFAREYEKKEKQENADFSNQIDKATTKSELLQIMIEIICTTKSFVELLEINLILEKKSNVLSKDVADTLIQLVNVRQKELIKEYFK